MKNRFGKTKYKSDFDSQLFSGIRLRFSVLNQTEKVVCFLIVLIPVWWLWGWSYLLIPLTLSIFAYEIKQTGKLSLNQPSLIAILAFSFGLYVIITSYFYLEYNDIAYSPRTILSKVDSWLASALLLWYIQSNNIRIRLQVVAWAFSVVIVQITIVLLVSLIIYQQRDYVPLQSLFGFITGKSADFEHGLGNSNYLIPYFPTDESFIPGLVRYVFFFHGPESLALVAGFITLLALDLKNSTWSLLLFGSSYFISLLSGTRSVFVALFLVFILRYIITIGKTFGIALVLAMMAAVSFSTLSLPLTSNIVFDRLEQTAQSVGEARADSTEGRSKIYTQTWKKIVNAPNTEFFWGHKVPGENVTAYPTAKIGSHSFYLSTLLYRSGLFATIIFVFYWIALIWWFYSTRASRPLSCLMILTLFSLTFCVMELEQPVMPIILICSMLRKSGGS
ncbi:MAG: hypothetical protein QNJ72_26600 [Pleurocapsa sp. MO_226.B13]|nr:hypothetical protein [Pleurocapsa sp. MO_226.B13]